MNKVIRTSNTLQHGGVLFVVLVLLLTLCAMVILSSLRQNLFVNSMSVNSKNLALARTNAETGMASALNRLQSDPTFMQSQMEMHLKANNNPQGKAKVNISRHITTRFSDRMELIKVTAIGQGSDPNAQVILTQQVLRYPLLRATPTTPIMIRGKLNVNTVLSIVYDPPNFDPTSDKLILLADALTVTSNIFNCSIDRYKRGDCTNNNFASIYQTQAKGPATDLLPFLFNIRKVDWPYLQDEFKYVLKNCEQQNLPSKASSFWVIGDCWLDGRTVLGTPQHPIIMVVQNGDLYLRGQNKIYGLLVILSTSHFDTTHNITLVGQNQIHGGFVANTNVNLSGGTMDILFNNEIIDRLFDQTDMWKLVRIPGSWRDYK